MDWIGWDWIGSLKHSHTRAPLCGANKDAILKGKDNLSSHLHPLANAAAGFERSASENQNHDEND